MTSIHADLTGSLGARIAAGDIAPGTVLTLARLEADYEASRTVVRETVRVLETMGMVASRRRVGITVQPREEWDAFSPLLIQWNLDGPFRRQQLESLMEVRVAVEPTAARLAAVRASSTQRAELRRLAARLRALGDRRLGASPAFLDTDVAFHAELLRASGNLQLAGLSDPVGEVLRGRSRLGLTPEVPAEGTLEQHELVAAAIARGDADAAEDLSRGHMRQVWTEIHVD